MPTVNFIAFDGRRHAVDVPTGTTLMRAATDHGVPGIDGDCGGQCACATCHIYIDAPWNAVSGARTSQENEMLNFSAGLQDSSRLACQITMSDALDGIVVTLPEGQH
ncbi:MAG: 2Fe-2S iron-sulfur cluster binding domain-containing protein [Rubrivivax sp.]|nr:2Fe-2S iron-sulfur cluster binding domain-containing protein [Rubrivivax sp.]MBK7261026.1 2Fe-2S iron-sulfur cluster binding domain-containing protein [Rubrivivax sp.]MBK8525962.1 2Fe-2S iron-sulfur cluster binding domain-containing protein [Rubrivivax sp.]